jgi:hypothetical protein
MVRHVIVNGRPVVVDRKLVDVSAEQLKRRIGDAWEATQRRMAESQ